MTAPFVHLRLHTEYSLVDGLIRIKGLVKRVAAADMPAVAVTDMSNLFALIKFYKAALGAGIKPIIGVEAWVGRGNGPCRLVLLCQNLSGYRHLTRLVSRSFLEGQQRGVPVIDYAWLEGNTEGLIALSGGRDGELGQALLNGRREQAERDLADWRRLFPDRFYLEVQRTGRSREAEYLEAVLDLAVATGTPVVATNDVCFLRRDDFEAHEARVCVYEGATVDDPRRPHRYSEQQYLRTPAEMAELFADLPEALENSVEIARRCNLRLELGKNVLPDFPVPAGMTADAYFSTQARAGLEQRLRRLLDPATPDFAERRQPYDERLEEELGVIIQMGFPGYFLIVADFIRWARDNGVPVGPGRGSGAGSLVAYALGITDLDPLAYDLLFERFLNPERVSMPDFDIDFCMEGRDRVIDYVAQRYGRDRVSQIATHGTMAAKAVVRDVGRVLGHPYGFVDRIAKLIPFEIGMTLDKAIEREAELRRLYENDQEVRALLELARKLEGLARNVGKHAGGVVIAPSELTDFSPLYREQGDDSSLITQFDKDDVEAAGLVKFDFLGLRTLTIIDWAVQTLNERRRATGEPPLDITAIPLVDREAFDLLKRHQTTAVFQLESSGMKDLIRRLQPDCFEDIVALVALFRPGPLQSGMVDDFIDRKHGRARIEYPHPALATILKPTYGVILYQEQVMQIAQVLAGYTLGGADLLRRAMGKKKPEEMAKQREIFVNGSVEREVEPETASYIFDLMEKFAGYGFNKCVRGDTVIVEATTGETTTVEMLFKNPRPFAVHALDEAGKIKIRSVADVVWNGRKPIFELTTALGKRIVATANHPFRTLEAWTPLEKLRIGDRIAVPRKLEIASKKSWPQHELIVLAGLLSEGNTCHPTCLYFFGNEPLLVRDFAEAAAQFPHSKARVYSRSDGRMEVCVSTGHDCRFKAGQTPWNARHPTCGSLALAVESPAIPKRSGAFLWAQNLDLLGRKAVEKSIPHSVYELCDADLELFLGRLWAGDGFIASAAQAIPPFYATSSQQLAAGVQSLLLRLGIVSRIENKQFKYRGGLRSGFAVWLLGESMLETFLERIAPHIVGRESQIELLRRRLTAIRPGMTSKDTVPAEVRGWVAAERARRGLTWKQLEQGAGLSMKSFQGSGSPTKRGFRRSTITRLAQFLKLSRLSDLADSDLYWDRVVAIEPKGTDDTYDLTVEGDHNFVANGIVVHNSHSAAYALVSYQTAWLKAHHPAAFMAAVLSSDMDKTDKVVVFIEECRRMGLKLAPPDINQSEYRFTVGAPGEILYGLGAIKGVGEAAIEHLVEERRRAGPYRDLFDLCRRADLHKLNRRVLDALIRSGAFDALGPNRATLDKRLPDALQLAEQHSRNDAAGQNDLFGLAAAEKTPARLTPAAEVAEWDDERRLHGEKETLGVYLTGHPIHRVAEELAAINVTPLRTVMENGGSRRNGDRQVLIAGLVVSVRTRNANRGGRIAFVMLDDASGRLEIRVFPETYERYRALIKEDEILVVQGALGWDEFNQTTRLNVERVLDLGSARAEYARRLVLKIDGGRLAPETLRQLAQLLIDYRSEGRCAVWADYLGSSARVELAFGSNWQVRPDAGLLDRLRELPGVEAVRLGYETQPNMERNSLA